MFDDVECNVLCIVDAMVHVLGPQINAQSPRVWCIMCSLHLPVLVPGLKLSQNSPNVFSWLRGVKECQELLQLLFPWFYALFL